MTIFLPKPGSTDPVTYRWMQDVTRAANTPTTAATVDLSGFLPNTATVKGIGALGFTGTLADGTVLLNLKPLADTGVGAALVKTTFDAYGRREGTQAATTDDLTEGANLYYTQARADARVAVGIQAFKDAPALTVANLANAANDAAAATAGVAVGALYRNGSALMIRVT